MINYSERYAADAEYQKIKNEYKVATKAYRKRKNKEGVENLKAAFSDPFIAGWFILGFAWVTYGVISSIF